MVIRTHSAYVPMGFWTLALFVFLTAPPGRAETREAFVAGVGIPEQTLLAGERLILNGAGLRRFLGLQVYVAALYLPETQRSAEDVLAREVPKRLQLTWLRDVSAERNIDALMAGFRANHSAAEMRALSAEIAQCIDLLRALNQVKAGAVINLDYRPGLGTQLSTASHILGTIPGEHFNRALLKIWLGEAPTQISLKRALLGLERPS